MKDKCEVLADYGKIGEKKDRLGKMCDVRLSKVSWHGRTPTYDIRMWSPDGDAEKGISLSLENLKELRDILVSMEL